MQHRFLAALCSRKLLQVFVDDGLREMSVAALPPQILHLEAPGLIVNRAEFIPSLVKYFNFATCVQNLG